MIASEEEDHPVLVEEAFDSKYVAVFDPLDGSSNIDAAISTGTIFGIFEETEVRGRGNRRDQIFIMVVEMLQRGTWYIKKSNNLLTVNSYKCVINS